jgi:hypothetical protein
MNVTVLKSDDMRILSKLTLTNPQMQKISRGEYVSYPTDTDYEAELAKDFLFVTHPPYMKVTSVFYPPDESPQIINMKKGLLNHFQFTLPEDDKAAAGYTAEENDSSGRYSSKYAMRCGSEHEHVHTLVKEHTLHNYSHMAHDATFKIVAEGSPYTRMTQRAVIDLNHTSGRVASSHIHQVVTLDGDMASKRKELLLEHTNQVQEKSVPTMSIPVSTNITLVKSRKGQPLSVKQLKKMESPQMRGRARGRRSLLAEAEEAAEDELTEDTLLANADRKANGLSPEYDTEENLEDVLTTLMMCMPENALEDSNATCFRELTRRLREQISFQCFAATQLAIAVNGSDGTAGTSTYHPRYDSASDNLGTTRKRGFLIHALSSDVTPCVQRQYANILLLEDKYGDLVDTYRDSVKNEILMHTHVVDDPQPFFLDAVKLLATQLHPSNEFMGTHGTDNRVDLVATLTLAAYVGAMHDKHLLLLDHHHVHQSQHPHPVERPEVEELLALLVNRSTIAGPLSNESLYNVPLDHMTWLHPKLVSPLFNPFVDEKTAHTAIHVWWAGHMQQEHVPVHHSRDLFRAWKDHVSRHFAEAHSNDEKGNLDQMAHSFIEWLCTKAPSHLVESFVPGAHVFRKPTKALVTHVRALSNARHVSTIPRLNALLHDHPCQKVRVAAVGALGMMRSIDAEDILLQHIGEEQQDFRVREEALEALQHRYHLFQHTHTHPDTHGPTQTALQQRQGRHTNPKRVLQKMEKEVVQIALKMITLPQAPKGQGVGGGLSADRIHLKRQLDQYRAYFYSQPKDVAKKIFGRLGRHPYYIVATSQEDGDMPYKPHPITDDDLSLLSEEEAMKEWNWLKMGDDDNQIGVNDIEPLFADLNRTGRLEKWIANAAADAITPGKNDDEYRDPRMKMSHKKALTMAKSHSQRSMPHKSLFEQVSQLCVATNRTDLENLCSKMAIRDVMRRRLVGEGRTFLDDLMDIFLREFILRLGFNLGVHKQYGKIPSYGAEILIRLRNEAEARFSMFGLSAFVDLDNEFKASLYLLGFEFILLRITFDFFAGVSNNFLVGAGKVSLRGINPLEALRSVVSQIAYQPDDSQLLQPSLVKALALNLKSSLLPQTQEFIHALPPIANASEVSRDDPAYCFNQEPVAVLSTTADLTHSFFQQLPTALMDIPRVSAMYEEGIAWQELVSNATDYERTRMYGTIDNAAEARALCDKQKVQLDKLSTALAENDRLQAEAAELQNNASIVADLAVAVTELPASMRSFFARVEPTFEASASVAAQDVAEVASFAAFANLTNTTSIVMANAPGATELTSAESELHALLSDSGCLAVEIAAADNRAKKAAAADVAFQDGTYSSDGDEGGERAEYVQLQRCLQNVSDTLGARVAPSVSSFDSVRQLLLELQDASEVFASTELPALEDLDATLRAMDERVDTLLSDSSGSTRRSVGSISAALERQDSLLSPPITSTFTDFSTVFEMLLSSAGVSEGLGRELAAVALKLQAIVDIDTGKDIEREQSPDGGFAANTTAIPTRYNMADAHSQGEEYRERVKQFPGPLVAIYEHLSTLMSSVRDVGANTLVAGIPNHDAHAKTALIVSSRIETLLMTLTGATDDIANYTNNIQITLQTFVKEDPSEDFKSKAIEFQNTANAVIEHLSKLSSKIDAISSELVSHVEANRDCAAFSDALRQQQFAVDALDSARTGEKGLGDTYTTDARIIAIRAALSPLLEVAKQVKPELSRLTAATALLASAARLAAKGMGSGGDSSADEDDPEPLGAKIGRFSTLKTTHAEATTLLLNSFLAPANSLYANPQSSAFAVDAGEISGVDVWAGSLGTSATRSTSLMAIVDVRRAATMGLFKVVEDLSPSGPTPIGPLMQLAQREVETLMHENLVPLTLGLVASSADASDTSTSGDPDDRVLSCMHTSRSFCPPKLGSQHLRFLQTRLLKLQKAVNIAASVCRFDERGPMGLNSPTGGSSASPNEVVQRLAIFANDAAAFTKEQALAMLDADKLAEAATVALPSDPDPESSNAFNYLRKTKDCVTLATAIVSKTTQQMSQSVKLLGAVEAQHTQLNGQMEVVDAKLDQIQGGTDRTSVFEIVNEFGKMANGFGDKLAQFELEQRDLQSSRLEQTAAQVSEISAPKMRGEGVTEWSTTTTIHVLETDYLDAVAYSEAIHNTLYPGDGTPWKGTYYGIGVNKADEGVLSTQTPRLNGTDLDPDHDWGIGLRGLNVTKNGEDLNWDGGFEKKISDFRLTLGVQFGIISPGYGEWGTQNEWCSDADPTTGEIPVDGSCLRHLDVSQPTYWPKSVIWHSHIIFDQGKQVKSKFAHFLNLASPSTLEFINIGGPKRYRFVVPGLFDSYTAKGIARVPHSFTARKNGAWRYFSWAAGADYSESSTTLLSLVPTGEQVENCRPSLFVAMQRDKCEGDYSSARLKCIRAIFMLHDEDDIPWQGSVGGVTTDEEKWVWTVDDGSVNFRNNGISNKTLPSTRKTMSRQCLNEPEMSYTGSPKREVQHITIDLEQHEQLTAADTDMVNGQIRLKYGSKKSLPVPVSMSGDAIYTEILAITGADGSALKQCSRTELPNGGVRWEVIFDADAGDIPEIEIEYEGDDCCCSCCTPILKATSAQVTNETLIAMLVAVTEHTKGDDGSPAPIVEELCYDTGHSWDKENQDYSFLKVHTFDNNRKSTAGKIGTEIPCHSNFLVGFDLWEISKKIETCNPYCSPTQLKIQKRWSVDSYPGGVHYQKMDERYGNDHFTPKAKPQPKGEEGLSQQTWEPIKIEGDAIKSSVRVPLDWLWIHDSVEAAKMNVIPAHHIEGSVVGYPLDTFNREPFFHEHNLDPKVYAYRMLLDETRLLIIEPVKLAVRQFGTCLHELQKMADGGCTKASGIGAEAIKAFLTCEWQGSLERWGASAMNTELSQKLGLPHPDTDAGAGGLLERVHDAIVYGRYAPTMAAIQAKGLQWAASLMTSSTDDNNPGSPTSATGSKLVLPFSAEELKLLSEGKLARANASGVAGVHPSPLQTALRFLVDELTAEAAPSILLAGAADGVSVSKRRQLGAELISALLVHEADVDYPVAMANCVVRQTANTSCVKALAIDELRSSAQLQAVPPSLQQPMVDLDAVAVGSAVHALAEEQMSGRRVFTGRPTPMPMSEVMRSRALPIANQSFADFTGAFFAALEPHVPSRLRIAVFPVPDLNEVTKFVREEVPKGLSTAFDIPFALTLAAVTKDAAAIDTQAKLAAFPPSTLLTTLKLKASTQAFAQKLSTCDTTNTSATCDLQAVSTELLKLAGDYLGNRTSASVNFGFSTELGNAVIHAASFGDTAHLLEKLGHAINSTAIGVDGEFVAAALVATMGFTGYSDAAAAAESSPASTLSKTSNQRKAQLAAASALKQQTARFLAHTLNVSGIVFNSSSSSSHALPFMVGKRALEASSLLNAELESFAVGVLANAWAPGTPSSTNAITNAITATGTGVSASTTACTAATPTLTPGSEGGALCSAANLGVASLRATFTAASLRNIRSAATLLPVGIGRSKSERSRKMPEPVRTVVLRLLEQLEYSTFSGTAVTPATPVTSTTTASDVQNAIKQVLVSRLNDKRPLTNETSHVDTWSSFVGHALSASASLVLGASEAQGQLSVLLPADNPYAPSQFVGHVLDVSALDATFDAATDAASATSMYSDVTTMATDVLTTAYMCSSDTLLVKGVETKYTFTCWSADDTAAASENVAALFQAAVSMDAELFITQTQVLAKALLTTTSYGSSDVYDAGNGADQAEGAADDGSADPKAYSKMSSQLATAVATLDGPAIAKQVGAAMVQCMSSSNREGKCPEGYGDIIASVGDGDTSQGTVASCDARDDKINQLSSMVMTQAKWNCAAGLCLPRISELDTVGGTAGTWMAPLLNGMLQSMLISAKTSERDMLDLVDQQLTYDPMMKMSPPEFPRGVYRPTHQFHVGKDVKGFALVVQFRNVYAALTRCEYSAAKDCMMEYHAVDLTSTLRDLKTKESEKTWSDGNINWDPIWLVEDDTLAIQAFTGFFMPHEARRWKQVEPTKRWVAQYNIGDNDKIPNTLWPRSSVLNGLRAKYWWFIEFSPMQAVLKHRVPMGIEGIAYDWREVADHLYVVMSSASKEHIDQVESMGLLPDDGYYKMRPPIMESRPLNVSNNEWSVKAVKMYGWIPIPTWIQPPKCIVAMGPECDKCICQSRPGGCKLGAGKRKGKGCTKAEKDKIKKFKEDKEKKEGDDAAMEKNCKKNCETYCRCEKKGRSKQKWQATTKEDYDKSACTALRQKCRGECSKPYLSLTRQGPGTKCKAVADEDGDEEDERNKEDGCDEACKKKKAGKCDDNCGKCKKGSPQHKECTKALAAADKLRDEEEAAALCNKGASGNEGASDFAKCKQCAASSSKCKDGQLLQRSCDFCQTMERKCKAAFKLCKPGTKMCGMTRCGEDGVTEIPTKAPTSSPTKQKECFGNDVRSDDFKCGPGYMIIPGPSVRCGMSRGCTKEQCCESVSTDTMCRSRDRYHVCRTDGWTRKKNDNQIKCADSGCTDQVCCTDNKEEAEEEEEEDDATYCEGYRCTGTSFVVPAEKRKAVCANDRCDDDRCCVGPEGAAACDRCSCHRCATAAWVKKYPAPLGTCGHGGCTDAKCCALEAVDKYCQTTSDGPYTCRTNGMIINNDARTIKCATSGCTDAKCCYTPTRECAKCGCHTCSAGTSRNSQLRGAVCGPPPHILCQSKCCDDAAVDKYCQTTSDGPYTCRTNGMIINTDARTIKCATSGCTDAKCCYTPGECAKCGCHTCSAGTSRNSQLRGAVCGSPSHALCQSKCCDPEWKCDCATCGQSVGYVQRLQSHYKGTFISHGVCTRFAKFSAARDSCVCDETDRRINTATWDEKCLPYCRRKRTCCASVPDAELTDAPTSTPTDVPTDAPTTTPTDVPTISPTSIPTDSPTNTPTDSPTTSPTADPTSEPTKYPTATPSESPTTFPTKDPTAYPTPYPTNTPTEFPTPGPTVFPTAVPSAAALTKAPTTSPTNQPTYTPTTAPTDPTCHCYEGEYLTQVNRYIGGSYRNAECESEAPNDRACVCDA